MSRKFILVFTSTDLKQKKKRKRIHTKVFKGKSRLVST